VLSLGRPLRARSATGERTPRSRTSTSPPSCSSKGAAERARDEVVAAERLLEASPQHWAWLHVGVHRAVWSAEEGDEARLPHWWQVADRARARASRHARPAPRAAPARRPRRRRGWGDVERRARSLAG
jgi:hypothetical protein